MSGEIYPVCPDPSIRQMCLSTRPLLKMVQFTWSTDRNVRVPGRAFLLCLALEIFLLTVDLKILTRSHCIAAYL